MHEILEAGQALERGRTLDHALIRSLSRVTLGPTAAQADHIRLVETDPAQLIEARFFNAGEEVRIFRAEDGLQAVLLWEGAEDTVIERTCPLANDALFGSSVTVRQLLRFDEDGQASVCCTRLAGWEGGCPDGK